MNDLRTIWNGLDWTVITGMFLSAVPALACITVHELCHGLAAYKLGDTTARDLGRLTLNPVKHIDIMGLLMMMVLKFGWAKPVPVNMRNFKRPKRDMAITALAGPLSNIALAAIMMFLYGILFSPLIKTGSAGLTMLDMINMTARLSIGLAVFNILPVPPLDGSKILFSLMPDQAYLKLMRYERYGMIALLLLVWTGILGTPLSAATSVIYGGVSQIADWAYGLVSGAV